MSSGRRSSGQRSRPLDHRWATTAQLAKHEGLEPDKADKVLRQLEAVGYVEHKQARTNRGKVDIWRLTQPATVGGAS